MASKKAVSGRYWPLANTRHAHGLLPAAIRPCILRLFGAARLVCVTALFTTSHAVKDGNEIAGFIQGTDIAAGMPKIRLFRFETGIGENLSFIIAIEFDFGAASSFGSGIAVHGGGFGIAVQNSHPILET